MMTIGAASLEIHNLTYPDWKRAQYDTGTHRGSNVGQISSCWSSLSKVFGSRCAEGTRLGVSDLLLAPRQNPQITSPPIDNC